VAFDWFHVNVLPTAVGGGDVRVEDRIERVARVQRVQAGRVIRTQASRLKGQQQRAGQGQHDDQRGKDDDLAFARGLRGGLERHFGFGRRTLGGFDDFAHVVSSLKTRDQRAGVP